MRKGLLYAVLITTTCLTGLVTRLGAQNLPDQVDQTQGMPTERDKLPDGTVAVFKVEVIGRTVKAVNYRNRESTRIGFEGTSLLAGAQGEAAVQNKQGSTRVHASFKHLTPAASQFGPPCLTYVLWAITPDGRPTNLGEIIPNQGGSAIPGRFESPSLRADCYRRALFRCDPSQ
jgi:hypothetical protein